MTEVPERVFQSLAPEYMRELLAISEFLSANPELAPKARKGDFFGTEAYWKQIAAKFVHGRSPRTPRAPETVPDSMVSIILEEYFDVDPDGLPQVMKEHSLAMAAENIVGDLLERYIASALEPCGWVWCSGEVIKKVDFLAVKGGSESEWQPLQVKNRDNSENSSSSSVREGTSIIKWFRTFSRTGATNWGAFPESLSCASLSENDFKIFAKDYLNSLKL